MKSGDARKAGAGQVVLVVDDEPIQRMMVSDMLYEAGFWSVEAGDAHQALQTLESRSDIRIVFTDIKMPHGIDGLDLVSIVRRRWPDIEIAVVSGSAPPTDEELPGGVAFFQKPYRHEDVVPVLLRMAARPAGSLPVRAYRVIGDDRHDVQ